MGASGPARSVRASARIPVANRNRRPGGVSRFIFVFGSPDASRDKINDYVRQGIMTPIINMIPTARDAEGQRKQSLEAFRALAPR